MPSGSVCDARITRYSSADAARKTLERRKDEAASGSASWALSARAMS